MAEDWEIAATDLIQLLNKKVGTIEILKMCQDALRNGELVGADPDAEISSLSYVYNEDFIKGEPVKTLRYVECF